MRIRVLPKLAEAMRMRGIAAADLERTVREPERKLPGHSGRERLIRRVEGGRALILATVEYVPSGDVLVVSAVRTTDFKRYWKEKDDD